MKKLLSLLFALSLTLSLCLSLASCTDSKEIDIAFGEKYTYKNEYGKRTLVFNEDGTGTYTILYEYYSKERLMDATVTFKWHISNDENLYLFADKVTFGDACTHQNDYYEYAYLRLTDLPCTFSSELIGYMTSSGSLYRFVNENSPLFALNPDNAKSE